MERYEPTWAERARTALAAATVATLTTGRCPGPRTVTVASVVPQPDGHPLVRLETTSAISQALAACPVATLTVPGPDPCRALTLTGTVLPHRSPAGHRLHRLSVLSVRLVGAAATTIPVRAFLAAEPDPLREHARATMRHLETAHPEDLLCCLRAHGQGDALAVVPRVLDRYGLEVAVLTGDGVRRTRLCFPGGPVSDLEQVAVGLRTLLTCRCTHEDR